MSNFSFNLNELPEVEINDEDDIPLLIRSSTGNTLVIDLNTTPDSDVGETILELNTEEIATEEETSISGVHNQNQPRTIPMLTNSRRWEIYYTLLQRSVGGKLKHGTTKEVASLFSVSMRTIQRIWKQAKDTPQDVVVNVSHRKTGNCVRKRVQVDLTLMSEIPLNRRTTLRLLAQAIGVNHVTLYRLLQRGRFCRHSSAVKPHLKEENKIARLEFCISMLDSSSLPFEPKFQGMYNVVHIDEKWFFMTKKSRTYYLLPEEEDPLRTCQSKNFIGKVMFLSAVARPRYDDEGNEVFSGKSGIFPFVTKQPALRRSRNREAGTLETKPITSMTKEIIRAYLLEKVIPAIQSKWPREDQGTIFIQQDNARPHVNPNDEDFRMAASQGGYDIRLTCQPPNSPDMNVLDLGFFNSIQSIQDKECTRTVDELIHVVEKSFDEYPADRLNRVFLSWQLCMRETMKIEGSNRYKIPHIDKDGLERNGSLPKQIPCDYDLVENVKDFLSRRREQV